MEMNASSAENEVLEAYMKKSRFDAKHAKPRMRYVVFDSDKDELLMHEKKGKHCYKKIPLQEIERVVELQNKSFIITMREVATSEKAGSTIRYDCETEDVRNKWVRNLEHRVNGEAAGFCLTRASQRQSIHKKYDCSIRNKGYILGSGMSGDVRRITRRSDGHTFAMKTVNLSGINKYKLASLRREIDILKSLDHPHIARLHETFVEQNLCVRLVMELCEGGELYERLLKRKKFTERYTCRIITKMLKALNYLHSNNIVHRDLKLENWLFRHKESDQNPDDDDIVLIDFGLSNKYRSEEDVMTKKVGTCYYIAPEVLGGSYHGGESDMWSLGVICYMLLSGRAPFDGKNDDQIRQAIESGKAPKMTGKRWERISKEAKEFVMGLLERDVDKRLTAEGALDHDWISSGLSRDDSIHSQLEGSILLNLKNYAKFHELKRLAMEVIAFNLDHDDIKELTELFEEIDTHNCGTITFDDLFQFMNSNESISEEEVRTIFNAMDEGGHGRIHVSEFVAGTLHTKYRNDEHLLAEAFALFDTDGNGRITSEDLKHLLGSLATEERVERIMEEFHEVNHCNNDEITFDDFLVFVRSDGEKDVKDYKQTLHERKESLILEKYKKKEKEAKMEIKLAKQKHKEAKKELKQAKKDAKMARKEGEH
mmetsp:Transcript_9525/g.10853  ORF Transcript_9525/g.10853 Transcript_9525/m.10853 type:complete len:654 (-) Transcript_9525:424-2385(-)|eukprot:CAMPEP_0184013790 /NCGR_PEP_ID=MMETSP0954-20121128/5228_1 /TAXON_ID=627963 /ORGANISM="Aplanochytrium sp, Strain PBS07" /LENGTH=653 /DNA_ID=CAMNT_0026294057 /DNA_START=167 /DNA_END=2128 /DNA_ORIENTATION=+